MSLKQQAKKNLFDIADILDELGIEFVLDGGTLLGAYRDKDFCEDDEDDVDLTTLAPYTPEITEKALAKGFELLHSWPKRFERTAQLAFKREGVKVDIMFKEVVGTRAYWTVYAGNKTVRKEVPSLHYQRTRKLDFLGREFKAPSSTEKYLAYRYGYWKKKVHRREYSYLTSDQSIVLEEPLYRRGIAFGSFDVFHVGHWRLLSRAKNRSKHLVVALATDELVTKRKGKLKFPYEKRKEILESLPFVDEVAPYSSKELSVLKHQPDAIFVGDDWASTEWDGVDVAKRHSIKIEYLPHTPGVSTTKLSESGSSESIEDYSDITAIVKTFLRDNYLFECVRSLRSSFPGIKILVADSGKITREKKAFCKQHDAEYFELPWDQGICVGRNFLLKHVKTPYFLVGDDDFYYDAGVNLKKMRTLLEIADVVGGAVRTDGLVGNYERMLEKKGSKLIHTNVSLENLPTHKGIKYAKCDMTYNFFLAKSSVKTRWDENIKVAYEHSDWFLQLKEDGYKVVYTPESIVVHRPGWVKVPHAAQNEYNGYRMRQRDKDYFYKKHGITEIPRAGNPATLIGQGRVKNPMPSRVAAFKSKA